VSAAQPVDVAIVGAGLAGLAAARALTECGRRVVLVDKGRRPGGRCATRTLAGATVDTGAQFFTVRSDAFRALVEGLRAEGCPIREWSRGFARAASIQDGPGAADTRQDGHPRHSLGGGMNALAAHLAVGLDVRKGVRALAVGRQEGGWALDLLDGARRDRLATGAVVVTPPLPQSLALLGAGGVEVPARLRAFTYEPCLTLLVRLDRPASLPGPGGVQFAGGPIGWLADNVVKGASAEPALTVHASGDLSEALYDLDGERAAAVLLDGLGPWLGPARPIATEVFRWRYSKPRQPADDVALAVADGLVLAGDALAGGKVEGAVTSGLRAADLLTTSLPA